MTSNFWKSSSLALLCAGLICAAEELHPDYNVKGGGLAMKFDADKGTTTDAITRIEGSDFITGGIDVGVSEGVGHVSAVLDKDVRVRHELGAEGGHLRWRVTLANRAKTAKLLEVRCAFTANFAGPAQCWDGYEVRGQPGESSARSVLAQTFPMTCAFTARAGIAIGLKPDTFCSWLEHAWVTRSPTNGRLSEAVRVALNAQETQTVTFVLYAFRPSYGHLDALQVYYEEFPEWFRAASDVDPRATGGGATYWCWGQNSPEMCRRFHGDWEWCYAPFHRTGDWYGRPEFWNYQPARPFDKERGLPLEEFSKKRAEKFDRGKRCNTAMMFYLPANIWCEIQLANERYKDAIVLSDGKPMESHRPWVTGHDDELIVFPWETSFAEACKRDMRQIVGELNVAGFAFDTANGGIAFRGPSAAKCPGRAWDAQGAFVDLGVAVAKMEDFVHSLRTRDDRRCALISNPTGRTTFPICFRSDTAMHEYAPYRQADEQRSVRYLLGHKTMVWWDDFNAAPLLNWREMSPEEIRDAYARLADFVLLRSLYMGGIPTPRLAVGVRKLAEALPMIYEIVRAGWQPVPAFRPTGERAADAGLWAARYGNDLGTFLTLGNASLKDFAGDIEVENNYLGNATFLFTPYGNGSFSQTLADGKTRIAVNVATRQAAALRAALALPAAWHGQARVERNNGRLRIELECPVHRPGAARLAVPAGEKLASLTVNGKRTNADAARFDLSADGKTIIEASFASPHFASPRQAILDFDFSKAGIMLSRGASSAERDAARALQEYFRFYYSQAQPHMKPAGLEIHELAGTRDVRGVVIIRDGPARMDHGNLIVNSGPGAMEALRRLLDTKYFVAGRFPASGEDEAERELIRKSNLAGKVLE